jgi:3-deoxy-D-manno-octulosonic-acid transferase
VFLVYRGLTWLALGAVPFYVLIALLRRPGRWREVGERFAVLPPSLVRACRNGIWIQAASVGELQLARVLVEALGRRRTQCPMAVSVTTPAARRLAPALLPETVACFTFPVDLPPVVRRAVGTLRPRLFVALETELWPNLYDALNRRGIPVVLANGRISDAGLRRYRRVRGLMRRVLAAVSLVCSRSEEDADRFRELGISAGRIVALGDLKFDRPPPRAEGIPSDLFPVLDARRVLIAGSTHGGEDEVALEAARLAAAGADGPPILVVLAPRHLERVADVERLLSHSGLPWARRSRVARGQTGPEGRLAVMLLDTHGELSRLYPAARACLLGGTLAPVGGHNPLEAAAAGVPVVTGPHIANVPELVATLQAAGGLIVADDAESMARHLARLLVDREESQRRGEAARQTLEAHRGATARTIEHLQELLRHDGSGSSRELPA